MASTVEELGERIGAAIQPGYRSKLLARGQARAMIWHDGVLPPDAPQFSPELSYDLLSYGYSLLAQTLRFVELGGERELSRTAFEVAAEALEAVVAQGVRDEERDFHRLVAAAAYHLGQFSARAYSLLQGGLGEANLTAMESCLAKLMLRDLNGLGHDISAWFSSGEGTEDALIRKLRVVENVYDADQGTGALDDAMITALEDNFMAALATATLGLERGEDALVARAHERLHAGVEVAGELNKVTAWWCQKLAMHLIDGLWDTSFHKVLPNTDGGDGENKEWGNLRKLFIASLYRRGKAEIELWPSQVEAARRVLDLDANLVLSLPTSAGKTRIAELCILACLASKRRVVYVTPLRALSAQTEVGLRRTFGPLGKTVSSLYGSIGAHGADFDALRGRDIVVATPEKLDFALRSDPSLFDDVGLVVLDEGHMIGIEEREVRYEAQIQRLLRRPDSASRRIVCLSAILPDGTQLEDFSAWLTGDKPDGLIKNPWRPTRLRFGEVEWVEDHARLNITVGSETPFVPRFLVEKFPSKGKGRRGFPSDQSELCIATAWRLVDEGHTVLVFCPLRASVMPLAKRVVAMHARGHIDSVLTQPEESLSTALAIGEEWFGPEHDILKCLKLGVAVHHGTLPTPYRKEVERLLREGTLQVTISSPTLAQGLNLTATCLVFHGLVRNKEPIPIAEFRNVVGRAGRAYVDIEGLVLYPMFDEKAKRRAVWNDLVTSAKGREMESGILRLLMTLLRRIKQKTGAKKVEQLFEYIGGQAGWSFPELRGERKDVAETARNAWPRHLMSLDTAIFSLFGDVEVPDEQVEEKLDEVLESSLFTRRIARLEDANWRKAVKRGLVERTKHIWHNSTSAQRRGYFLAGLGLESGKRLDERADELEELLLTANVLISSGDTEHAIDAIEGFAEIAFSIPPFVPKKLPEQWREVLRQWLLGQSIASILGGGEEVVEFIESGLVYSLPWAMEAVRVRAAAHEDGNEDSDESVIKLNDYPGGGAVLALETGTLSIPAAILIQSGFSYRLAAIKAVDESLASFDSVRGMKAWLKSPEVEVLSWNPDWPTEETHEQWMRFREQESESTQKPWSVQTYTSDVKWSGVPMPPGAPLRLGTAPNGRWAVYDAEYNVRGTFQKWTPNVLAEGLFVATATGSSMHFSFEYIGPDDMLE